MPAILSPRVVFASIPNGLPIPGENIKYDATLSIDLDSVPLDGGFLTKTLVLSSDPYLRGKLRDPSIKSYSPPFLIGNAIAGFGIGVVLRSERADLKPGDHLYGQFPWEYYTVHPASSSLKPIQREPTIPWSAYIGVLGMPGKTAYYGFKAVAEAKQGETIFVSTAAGAVGSVVVQLAKLAGLRVIGSAGSAAKVDFVKSELGADIAFNYKDADTREVLKKEGPIDIYWDNVGGETLDAALEFANRNGRIIICGRASQLNNKEGERYLVKNFHNVLSLTLTVRGFLVGNLEAQLGSESFYNEVPRLVREGKIKYKEHVWKGLDKAPEAFVDMLKGGNFGKTVVVVAEE